MVINEMRKIADAAFGALSPAKAQELARSLMKGEGTDQVAKTAKDLVAWSARNRERMSELVRSEVRAQLQQLGVASRDEVEALRKRVRELEKSRSVTRSPTARKPAPRSSVKQPGTAAPTPTP